MKKIYFIGMALGMATALNAQTIGYQGTNPKTTASVAWDANQDMHVFSTVPTDKQEILTFAPLSQTYSGDTVINKHIEFHNWIVSCLVTDNDFKGKIDGSSDLKFFPKFGEIKGLFLSGHNNNEQTIKITSYVKPFLGSTLEAPSYLSFSDYALTEQVSETEYNEVPEVDEEEEAQPLFKSNFIKPYTYRGGNVSVDVKLEQTIDMDFAMNIMNVTPKVATVYRGKGAEILTKRNRTEVLETTKLYDFEPVFAGIQVYNLGDEFISRHGEYNGNYLGLKENALPAYGLNYFTNDIKISVVNLKGETVGKCLARLKNVTTNEFIIPTGMAATNNAITMDTTGKFSFEGLNPDDTYMLEVACPNYGMVTVKDVKFSGENTLAKENNDIVVKITFDQEVPTSVNNVESEKTIENVQYISPAGAESSTPFQGVNIVVKHYTDGSKTIAKQVIK